MTGNGGLKPVPRQHRLPSPRKHGFLFQICLRACRWTLLVDPVRCCKRTGLPGSRAKVSKGGTINLIVIPGADLSSLFSTYESSYPFFL